MSYGVAPQRWAGMSYGHRLLAALLGLHVRPEVPTAAGVAEASTRRRREQPTAVRTRPARREAPAPEATEAAGAGTFAVFAVLTPVLSGTAAVIFLLLGLVLKMSGTESALARTMINAGWLFGVVAVGTVVVCAVVLLGRALRRRGQSIRVAADYGERSEELARARDAWREALLERGIIPFLQEATTASSLWTTSSAPTSRRPRLGYDRPGFSSPSDDTAPAPRPSFTSPDFTSPDLGGPEHQRD